MSDWERRPLSERQLTYAALDAFVLLQIYDAIVGSFSAEQLQPYLFTFNGSRAQPRHDQVSREQQHLMQTEPAKLSHDSGSETSRPCSTTDAASQSSLPVASAAQPQLPFSEHAQPCIQALCSSPGTDSRQPHQHRMPNAQARTFIARPGPCSSLRKHALHGPPTLSALLHSMLAQKQPVSLPQHWRRVAVRQQLSSCGRTAALQPTAGRCWQAFHAACVHGQRCNMLRCCRLCAMASHSCTSLLTVASAFRHM